MKQRNSRLTWTAGLVGLLAGQAIHAQTEALELEEVVITGSRVVTNGNDSPTPVTVVTIQEMESVRPGTVADQLNDMPQFYGSQGQGNAPNAGSANGGNAGGQANVLNLRNFGTVRNLVLYDGHRVAPNSANGTVDVDMIPQLLLKRVDVVTGGASAVYGSDAITGVVNFVTDTKFDGLKINGQAGRSQENDGDTYAIGIGAGTDLFGGRGHIMGSYEFRSDDGVDARSDREWGRNRWMAYRITSPNSAPIYQLTPNGTRQDASFGGTISAVGTTPNPLGNYYFSSQGVASPVNPGVPIPNKANARDGSAGSGSYFDPNLRGQLETHQLFARLDYDFTDSVHGWVKFSGTDTYNNGYAISNPTYQASNASNVHWVFVSNPYLPASVRNQMTNNGTNGITLFGINKVFSGPGMEQYRQNTESFGRNYSIDTGLSGSFGDGWNWELAMVYGSNENRARQNNAVNGRKVAAALDAVVNPSNPGQIVCNVTLTNPTLYPGCVPMSTAFGPSISAAEAEWIFDPLEVTTNTDMTDFEGYVSGSPFNNWAGPVNVALSAQARKLSYEVISSTTPATLANPLDCTGLRLYTGTNACSPTSLEYFQAESLSRPKISNDVKEAALEFDMPLLKDLFLARDVSLNGAFRYTDYANSGSINSWKGGLNWKFSDELNFRGTRSRDIRAPTMHELYAPQSVGNFNGRDELLGVNLDGAGGRPNPAGVLDSGNESLRPELGDTVTAGLVYRPEFVTGLSMSADYYYIKVSDAIANYAGANQQLACINSGGASPLCQLIVRPINCCTTTTFNNAMTRVYTTYINLARQYTKGVDLELNYANRLFEMPFNMRLLASYQPESVNVDPLTGKETNNAGYTFPKWRGTLVASIEPIENLKVSVMERWRGSMNWFPEESGPGAITYTMTGTQDHVSPMFLTNLNVGYTLPSFGGKTEIYLNVQNLFDRSPVPWAQYTAPFAGLNGTVPGDDPMGRYFTVGFRYRM